MDFQIFGWLSLLGIAYTSFLYFWNMIDPVQGENRVKLHCSIGKMTLITVAGYLFFQSLPGFNDDWFFWLGIGLYLIIIASGVVLLYLPNAGVLRYHARSIHPALVVGLAVVILYYILMLFD